MCFVYILGGAYFDAPPESHSVHYYLIIPSFQEQSQYPIYRNLHINTYLMGLTIWNAGKVKSSV